MKIKILSKFFKKCSPTGIRTQVSCVKGRYPDQLDYRGITDPKLLLAKALKWQKH